MKEVLDHFSSLAVNLISAVICFFVSWMATRIRKKSHDGRLPLAIIAIIYFVGMLGTILLSGDSFDRIDLAISFALVSMVAGYFVYSSIAQYWSIGIFGVDRHTNSGRMGYEQSLKACTHGMEFLGIGASKLTRERKPFEDALVRCNDLARPVRVLLAHPQTEHLIIAAKNAGAEQKEYQKKVFESLKIIRDIKNRRSLNIDVRFYEKKASPLFRLMFINDKVCLASHYVLGKGDGSDQPQIYIHNFGDDGHRDSLYYGMKKYFDELWEQSEPWDFTMKSIRRK